jgi:ATP-dependent Clp protease ATP-binding subunit ClpA
MRERFTSAALAVMVAAEEEARTLRHGTVGSEHLLLGLVRVADGVPASVLSSLGIGLEGARSQVEQMVGEGLEPPGFGQLPLTPRARQVLRLAAHRARRTRDHAVGTDHLLIGLLRDGGGGAVRVLARLGTSPAAVRERYLQLTGLTGAAARSIRVAAGPRFDRYTDGARRAIARAQEEARILGHHYVGTEDLLLGLAGAGGDPTVAVLESLGVSAEAVRERAGQAAGQDAPPLRPPGQIPYTAAASRVIDLSLREALRSRDGSVGSEHILLSLIRDDGGTAVRILRQLGCDPAAVRHRLVG